MCEENIHKTELSYSRNIQRTMCEILRQLGVLAVCPDCTHGDLDTTKPVIVCETPQEAVYELVERGEVDSRTINFLRSIGLL